MDARYCADCGQKVTTHRLTLHEIGHEAMHALLHVDRSVLTLIRALALRPGRVALDYVQGRRTRYYGPFSFLIVSVAVTSAAIALTQFPAVTSDTPNAVASFLQHHVNLLWLFSVPITAAAFRALSPRGPFNYAEYLVLAAYYVGMRSLFFAIVNVGGWYVFRPGGRVAQDLYFALLPTAPVYLAFAASQFLPGSRWLSALKGVVAFALTLAASYGIVFAVSNAANLFGRR